MRGNNICVFIFSLFLSCHVHCTVAYYPKKLEKYFQKLFATLRGVAGPHPFFGKN